MLTIYKKKSDNHGGFGLIDSLIAVVAMLLLFPILISAIYLIVIDIDDSIKKIDRYSDFYDLYMRLFEINNLVNIPYWESNNFIDINERQVEIIYILGKKDNRAVISWGEDNILIKYLDITQEYNLPQHNIKFFLENESGKSILKMTLKVEEKERELLFKVHK